MSVTVEQTLEMPDAVLFVRKVQSALAAEQTKRRHFYQIVEENKKMEFINGEIIFHSPSPFCEAKAFSNLLNLVSTFVAKNKLGLITFDKVLVSLTRNDYEPDLFFFGNDKAKNFERKQVQFPAPDFVVEVLSDSTAKIDRETKFQDYAAHGIREYWIIDPDAETIEQYELQNDKYQLLLKAKDGNLEGIVLAGFVIPVRAVFDEELNLQSLTELLGK